MNKLAPTHTDKREFLLEQAEAVDISNADELSNEMLERALQIIADNEWQIPNQ